MFEAGRGVSEGKTINRFLSSFVRTLAWFTTFIELLIAALPTHAEVVNLYTGDSSYTVPIVTPPSTNGIGPNLSLSYSSGSGNGWLGEGWSLVGLGSIERVGPTGASPTYTASDSYRLNLGGSQKLIYVGVDPTGASGNYYRTEIESFMRIEFVSGSNYWVVTDKSGKKFFFGQSAASRQDNPGNATQVFSWKLDMVLDPHNLAWTVSYNKDAVGGDMYPAQVVYTQGPGLACTPSNPNTCRTVDFVLTPRTGGDSSISYGSGAKIVSDQLLFRIDVKMGGNLVRAYSLTTKFSGNSGDNSVGVGPRVTTRKTLLTAIDELGANGFSGLPPLTFTYNTNSADSIADTTNTYYDAVNNIYLPVLFPTAMSGSPVEALGGAQQNPPTPSNCTYALDMNGDALADILVGQAGNWFYYPNNGSGGFGTQVAIANPPTALPSLCASAIDYRRDHFSYHLEVRMGTFGEFMATPGAFNFRVTTWDFEEVLGIYLVNARTLASTEVISPLHDVAVSDVDGDGLPDILQGSVAGQWYWWRGLAGGGFADRASINPGATGVPITLSDRDVRLVDIDSDSLPDLVKLVMVSGTCIDASSTWRVDVYRNLGRDAAGVLRFSANASSSSNLSIHVDDPDSTPKACTQFSAPYPSNGLAFVDLNSDGLLDLVWFVRGKQFPSAQGASLRVWYYPNQGSAGNSLSFAPKVVIGGVENVGYEVMNQFHRWSDMNGDGLPDLMIGRGPTSDYPTGSYFYYPLNHYSVAGSNPTGYFYGRVPLRNYPNLDLTRTNFLQLTDMNGDGFPDVLQGNVSNYVYYTLNYSDTHQFLESARTALGGAQGFTYQRLRSGNTIRWVTSQTSVDDGLGAVNTSTYTYIGGKNGSWPHNEFRGYAQATVTDPAGHSNITTFHQDDAKKGRINTSETRSNGPNGTLMAKTLYTYASSTSSTGLSRVDLTNQIVETYDGQSLAKSARTDYGLYDAYGNARQITVSGTDITPRVTNTDFVYNTAAYIVDRSSHTAQTAGVTGAKISESWFDYDNFSNGVAPTKGDLTRETRWLSGGVNPVLQYAYDSVGNRIGTIDAKVNVCASTGYTTKILFDATYQTFPTTETNAICQVTAKTYWGVNTSLDAASAFAYPFPGLLATVTDPNGVRSDSYWDEMGRLYKSVMPPDTADLPTKQFAYRVSQVPNKITQYTSEAPTTHTLVDGLGRPIQVKTNAETSGQWITQDTWYNARGLVESVGIPYFSATNNYSARDLNQPQTITSYDAMRRPTYVTNSDMTYRTTAYNQWSVVNTDEKGYATTRTYDALQRLMRVLEAAGGGTTTYSYDSFDAEGNNTQKITDAAGNVSIVVFDTLGRKKQSNDPDLGAWNYTYDANGNLLTQVDAKLKTITYGYDGLNRIKTKTYPNSGGVISYLYDDATAGAYRKGRLWKVTDLSGSTVLTYDQRGRQTQIEKFVAPRTYAITKYTYDSNDRIATMTYPNNEVVTYSYNNQGLLDRLGSTTHAMNYIANLDYNAQGQITTKTAGNGVVTAYAYHPQNFRLTGLSTPGLQNLAYNYDNVGNVYGITDSLKANTQSFDYDNLHRLTSAGSAAVPGFTHVFDYDAIGNMRTGAGRAFTYPAPGSARPHAVTSDGLANFTYDDNGNMVTRVFLGFTRNFTWDYDNRLTQITDGSTVVANYIYDYRGQRVKKVEGTTTTITPFPHYRLVNGTATKYYFANGQRVAERNPAGAVYYYHPDHLGSSNVVSDSSGNEVGASLYYPYGAARTQTGAKTVAHRYTGQELDKSDLYYYGARYYDPVAMRFISADVLKPNIANPQELNHYSYVGNNPINYVDPTGQVRWPDDFNWIRSPDIYNFTLYYHVGVTVSMDRYGNWYGGVVVSPGLGGSLTAGYMNQLDVPSRNQIIDYAANDSYEIGGPIFGILGVSETYSPGSGTGTNVGIFTPGISPQVSYAGRLNNVNVFEPFKFTMDALNTAHTIYDTFNALSNVYDIYSRNEAFMYPELYQYIYLFSSEGE